MSTEFTAITEDFDGDLDAIRLLVNTFNSPIGASPKTRVAASNSSVLLLAATFEEFIRQMARAYARSVVDTTNSFSNLPNKMAQTAWRRTMKSLSRFPINANTTMAQIMEARDQFKAVYNFCTGDLSQDVYNELIYNENNMVAKEINGLFKVSGLNDVCKKIARTEPLRNTFGETTSDRVHGMLIRTLFKFIQRRNLIAHSLNAAQSVGPDEVLKDIDMFSAFAKALCETLEDQVSVMASAPRRPSPVLGSSGTTQQSRMRQP